MEDLGALSQRAAGLGINLISILGGLCWQKWLKSGFCSSGEFKDVFILIWGEKLKYCKELRIFFSLLPLFFFGKKVSKAWTKDHMTSFHPDSFLLEHFSQNISPKIPFCPWDPNPCSPEPFAGADARCRLSITLHVASVVTVILVGKKSRVRLGWGFQKTNWIQEFQKTNWTQEFQKTN